MFRVVAVVVADELGAQFFRWNHLDGIGPACFATIQQLKTAQLVEVLNDD